MQSGKEILSRRPFPSTSKAQPRGYKREVDQYAGKCVYERRTAANLDARATSWCTYCKHVKFAEHAEHAKRIQHVQLEHAGYVQHDELVKYARYVQYAKHIKHDEYGNGLCPWCADECDEHRNARHGP